MANRPLMSAASAQLPQDNALSPRSTDERSPEKPEPLQPMGGFRPNLLYERYGMLENPFGVTPNPRYLYESQTHAEARSSLIVGIECGVGFQALIAPPGMGKTTILFDVLERFHNIAQTAFLFQIHGDSRDFLLSLISELDGEAYVPDLVRMQETINRLLLRERRAGKRTIIIIDEAQTLNSSVLETVRLLSNFETPGEKLVQIILAGQPKLAERLLIPELAQLRQRISILATLTPFDLQNTGNYIEHRLRVAGYQGPPLFTHPALRLIWECSRGVPRDINTLCLNALLLATALDQKSVDADVLQEVVIDLEMGNVVKQNANLKRAIPPLRTDNVVPSVNAATRHLADVAASLSSSSSQNYSQKTPKSLSRLAQQARAVAGAEAAAILLGDEREMVCRAKIGSIGPAFQSRVSNARGLIGMCLKNLAIQRCDDTEVDTRVDARLCREQGIRSILCVPVTCNGSLVGVYGLFSSRPNAFAGLHSDILERIAHEIANEACSEAKSSRSSAPTQVGIADLSPRITPEKSVQERSEARFAGGGNSTVDIGWSTKIAWPPLSPAGHVGATPEKSTGRYPSGNSNIAIPAPYYSGRIQQPGTEERPPLSASCLSISKADTESERSATTVDLRTIEDPRLSRLLLFAASAVLVSITAAWLTVPELKNALFTELQILLHKTGDHASSVRFKSSEKPTSSIPWPYPTDFTDINQSIAYIKDMKSTPSGASLDVLRAAAATERPIVEYELGMRYANGSDVPQSYPLALEWFQKAAEQGIATAQWKLGLAYLNGLGTAADERKAAQWITRAANQGKPLAQSALSQLYFAGRGVPKDLVRAYTWASIASQELAVDEAPNLDLIRSQLTKDQLAAANKQIASWDHRNSKPVEPAIFENRDYNTTILDTEQ